MSPYRFPPPPSPPSPPAPPASRLRLLSAALRGVPLLLLSRAVRRHNAVRFPERSRSRLAELTRWQMRRPLALAASAFVIAAWVVGLLVVSRARWRAW